MKIKTFKTAASYLAFVGLLIPTTTATEFVQNGGFETGSLTDWSVTSPHGGPFVGAFVPPHSGSNEADWGETMPGDKISENLSTIAGDSYTFSFWLNTSVAGNTPNFTATWDGTPVLNITPADGDNSGWTQYSFSEVAAGPATISFTGSDPAGGLQLDDVSVTSAGLTGVPDSASTGFLLGSSVMGLALIRRAARDHRLQPQ